jgi:hypothetical protein
LGDSIVTKPIHPFKVGDLVRVVLPDDDLAPGQWFEAAVRTISEHAIWLDLAVVDVNCSDWSSIEIVPGFKLHFLTSEPEMLRARACCWTLDNDGRRKWQNWDALVSFTHA